ncbi:MAG: LysM peptidoglycan-binding domain-containing protein [Bacilli bacterium]|nr:LysM peptidoglycan-binding domain-containing protein [Bacilli bacterium]
MKIIIDPYRGGSDTGKEIDGQYEKNILLNISKYMSEKFNNLGITNELVRNNDISLTDEERTSIINEIKDKNDIVIQNRLSDDNEFDIIYPLRNSDSLPSLISTSLEARGINVDKYYQRRLPTNTTLDYYSVIRNTNPNEVLIIEYLDPTNYQNTVDIIVDSIDKYIKKSNTYIVKKGDSLYQIAIKYNTTVEKLKKLNNITSNSLSIGQVLKIPVGETESIEENSYTVQKGDSLYQIAIKYNTSVDELKKINNLSSNILSIGQKLILPTKKEESTEYDYYTVQKGDSLYQISKKYNITVDELKKLNNITSNLLSIGEKLKVPKTELGYIMYTVQKGDSLYQISKKYNVTVNDIKSLNNITSNVLSIGQELKIPR